MFWTTFKRVLESGWINFRRNGLVSYAAILVTTITLTVITGLFLLNAVLHTTIDSIQKQVDITVYFTVDAQEERILSLKQTLESLPEVAAVEYISADDEVLAFRERHSDDYLTLQALEELGNNPFGGNLRISAHDSTQYESIVNVLEGDSQVARDNAEIIDRINFAQNKVVIDRLNRLIADSRDIGLIVTIILSFISVIIMFTTVRLTIYVVHEEIGIMRLVGASNSYIRLPFVVEGMLYGFFAWTLTFLLFLPITYLLGRYATDALGLNLYTYYLSHFFSIAGVVLLIGLLLGALSSAFAVRKYLRS